MKITRIIMIKGTVETDTSKYLEDIIHNGQDFVKFTLGKTCIHSA